MNSKGIENIIHKTIKTISINKSVAIKLPVILKVPAFNILPILSVALINIINHAPLYKI